jgi:uncharacterized glyoxalase superfamily protein PhnB
MKLIDITPNLMVEDVNQTVMFYEDVLGFKLDQTVPEKGQFDWASVKSGEVEIMFQARASLSAEFPAFQEHLTGGTLTLFIRMHDIQELYERVRNRVERVQDLNVTFYGMREFSIKDPNGYFLTFAEPVV